MKLAVTSLALRANTGAATASQPYTCVASLHRFVTIGRGRMNCARRSKTPARDLVQVPDSFETARGPAFLANRANEGSRMAFRSHRRQVGRIGGLMAAVSAIALMAAPAMAQQTPP